MLPPVPKNIANSAYQEPVTNTLANGHIAVGSQGPDGEYLVVLDHSNTITISATLSMPVRLTTFGQKIAFSPLVTGIDGHLGEPVTTTLPNGHTAVGREGQNGESLLILDGRNTITVPAGLSDPMTVTTMGETLTFSSRPGAAMVGNNYYHADNTPPDDHLAVAHKGPNGESLVVLEGSRTTITLPALTTPTTLTAMGETITFSPPSPGETERGHTQTTALKKSTGVRLDLKQAVASTTIGLLTFLIYHSILHWA